MKISKAEKAAKMKAFNDKIAKMTPEQIKREMDTGMNNMRRKPNK